MGYIKILDTGYIKPTNEGTQATSQANSGNEITLKTVEFIPSLKRNVGDDPSLATNTMSEVNKGTLENMKFELRCYLDTHSTTDMNILRHLLDCIINNSYQIMWYDYTNASTEQNNGQLIYQLALNSKIGKQLTSADITKFGLSTQYYILSVIFDDCMFRHTGKSGVITYSFKGTVLKPETSVLS